MARHWIFFAYQSLRNQWKASRSDMAVFFFIATLLRYCISDSKDPEMYIRFIAYLDGLAIHRSTPELRDFPKIWEFYDNEERAFLSVRIVHFLYLIFLYSYAMI
jgi:hypothetical protein